MDANLRVVARQRTDIYPRAVAAQQTNVNLRVVVRQQTGVNLRAGGARRTDINPRVVAIQRTNGNPKVGSAHPHRQVLVRVKGRVEDLSDIEEVLTIFGGPHKVGSNLQARDRYAKEARRPT